MHPTSGKATIFAIAAGIVLFAGAIILDPFAFSPYQPQSAQAGTATTTVTVTNTPPQWSVDAQELTEYSTSSPVNAGLSVSFIGTGISSNGNRLYLLVCNTSTAPTANTNAAPTCAIGATTWGVSASTTSGVQMTSTYATSQANTSTNPWWAFLCDGDQFNALCNGTSKQGTGLTASPFIVNHYPTFTSTVDTSPANPGAVVTWTTVASDQDTFAGQDQVKLWVCKASDFGTSTCGGGGTWCSSTFANSDATCSSTLGVPLPWGNYNAYAYIADNHYFTSLSAAQATNTVLTVNNIAPSISSSSISLLNTTGAGPLALTNAQGQTTGFRVTFSIADNNSCMTQGGGNEFATSALNVYRSGIGQTNCSSTGQYDPADCYPASVGTPTWNYSCAQDGACTGTSTFTAAWTCTFPLWYIADPTDGVNATDTQYFSQTWQTSVRAGDSGGLFSPLVEAATGTDMQSYLAFVLNTTNIPYGSLAPGSSTPTLVPSTTLTAAGNVGMDETLYGTDMCTSFPSCIPGSTTSTIDIVNQRYATSSITYASGTAATSTTSTVTLIHILKTTLTSSPTFGATYWGIAVPGSITTAGNYSGQNTIIGVKSSANFW